MHPAERLSFRRFCRAHNLSEEDFISEALSHYAEKYRSALANSMSKPVFTTGDDALKAKILKAISEKLEPPATADIDGYFEYIRRNDPDKIEKDASALRQLKPSSAFSEPYLADICGGLGKPYSNFQEAVQTIARHAPRLHLVDAKFQGAIGRRSDLGVCVVEYPHLATVLEFATKLVNYACFVTEGEFLRSRQAWELVPLFDDEHFRHGLEVLSAWAAGETYKITYSQRLEPKPAHQAAVEYGADHGKQFVRLHEVFHLLLGHLERLATKGLEFQADAYAYAILTLNAGPSNIPLNNGVCAFFLCDHLIGNGLESSSHPTAEERVSRLVETLSATDLGLQFSMLLGLVKIHLSK